MSYSKEFLISELQRFYRENGRTPKQLDFQKRYAYPSFMTYHNYFKTWNNALENAKLLLNKTGEKRTGNEICYICDSKKQSLEWHTKYLPKGKVMCRSCYQKILSDNNSDYINKKLDKNSTVAKGFVGQRVVANVLGLELKDDCNCTYGFGHPIDLYDKDNYDKIDVKTSILLKKNKWNFNFNKKQEANTYICLGFDENRKNIEHVWIVPNEDKYKNVKTFCVNNTKVSLEFYDKFKVDPKPYNNMLHKMSEKRKETNGKECVLSNDDLI